MYIIVIGMIYYYPQKRDGKILQFLKQELLDTFESLNAIHCNHVTLESMEIVFHFFSLFYYKSVKLFIMNICLFI